MESWWNEIRLQFLLRQNRGSPCQNTENFWVISLHLRTFKPVFSDSVRNVLLVYSTLLSHILLHFHCSIVITIDLFLDLQFLDYIFCTSILLPQLLWVPCNHLHYSSYKKLFPYQTLILLTYNTACHVSEKPQTSKNKLLCPENANVIVCFLMYC